MVKVVAKTLLLASSIKRASLLNRVTYDLKLSLSHCLVFNKLAEDFLYLCMPMKCETKCPLNSLKVKTVLGVILLNHTLVDPLSVVGKALHMISFRTPYRCMRVLNNSRWSSGSFDPSYASTYGIWNLARRGKEVTCAVKGKSVRWTSSSSSVDTCPLMAFIIMSIFSFIICMSCATRIVPISSSDGRSVSCRSHLLAALLSF